MASCMASCMSHNLRGKDIRSQGSLLAEIRQLQDENVVLNRIVPYRIASLRVYHVTYPTLLSPINPGEGMHASFRGRGKQVSLSKMYASFRGRGNKCSKEKCSKEV